MNRKQSSVQVKSIKILVKEIDNEVDLSTQLDDETTIRILEVCLRNMKERASLKEVPIMGKENEYDQRRKK